MSRYKKYLTEGIDETGTPDMKYYAFDWDDNIMTMPTKIILKDDKGREVGMSTEDFAEYRTEIGNEPFEYEGKTIVGFAENPFRYFGVQGDKQFVVDSMLAKTGPAWNDASNHNGISSTELIKNLKKYRELADEDNMSNRELIKNYLDLCKFYPVSYGEGSATNPEEGKIKAMKEFIQYIREISEDINKKAFLKNKVSNNFKLPSIGFSDDDIRNVEKMKSHFEDEPILKTYSTAGGVKKLY